MNYYTETMHGRELRNVLNLPEELENTRIQVIIIPAPITETKTMQTGKRRLGFMPGPPIPESFFEPISDEELDSWGL